MFGIKLPPWFNSIILNVRLLVLLFVSSVHPSVRLGDTSIQDKCFQFFVKIHLTNELLFYNYFVRQSIVNSIATYVKVFVYVLDKFFN